MLLTSQLIRRLIINFLGPLLKSLLLLKKNLLLSLKHLLETVMGTEMTGDDTCDIGTCS